MTTFNSVVVMTNYTCMSLKLSMVKYKHILYYFTYYSYYCWKRYYRSVVFSVYSGFHHHHHYDIAEILLKVTLNNTNLTLTLENNILFRANIKRRCIFSCTRHVSGMAFSIFTDLISAGYPVDVSGL